MKRQKGSQIDLQMTLRMELETGPRTEISGGARRAVGPLARQVTGKWFRSGSEAAPKNSDFSKRNPRVEHGV